MADVAKLKSKEPFSVEELLKLSNTIDQFERYDRPHAARMAQMAEIIAIRIGMSGADLNALKIAALLHDIGELIMDAPAIRAEGYLDFRRRIELWRHPVIGEQQASKRGLPRPVQLLIRWHHEWWNGSGYPDMITGEAIPIGARILRLTDTYDSLTSSRPYRGPFEETQARAIIAASAGIEFDPIVVKIFFEIMEELDRRSDEDRAREKARIEAEAAAAALAAAVPIDEVPAAAVPVETTLEPAPEPAPEPANESASEPVREIEVVLIVEEHLREIIVEPITEPTVEPILEQSEETANAATVVYEVFVEVAPVETIERSAPEEIEQSKQIEESREIEGKSDLEEDAEHRTRQ